MRRRKRMRKRRVFVGVVLAAAGTILAVCPFLSNYLVKLEQEEQIVSYESAVDRQKEQALADMRRAAEEYNARLASQAAAVADPFEAEIRGNVSRDSSGELGQSKDPALSDASDSEAEYNSLLDPDGTGIMAYMEIPAINVYLPVYHGTSDDVLKIGAGHLEGTSLPVGGESTHTVLTGHTGLNTAKLFSDLTDLKEGDVFYLHVPGETLAYEVDQILVVEPSETSALEIVPGKDYCTLLTCTPYGVNSHRLLVRGERVEYSDETAQAADNALSGYSSRWMFYYKRVLTAVFLIITAGVCLTVFRRHGQRKRQM